MNHARKEMHMRLSILLFGIYQVLWIASKVNTRFKAFIRKARVRLLIKTADGRHAEVHRAR